MTNRKFFKVVARNLSYRGGRAARESLVMPQVIPQIARGIKPGKRGQEVEDFIQEFLAERGLADIAFLTRGDGSWSAAATIGRPGENDWDVITYYFKEVRPGELPDAASDLSTAELSRDIDDIWKALFG